MKHIRIKTMAIIAFLLFAGCKKYLNYQPQGALSASDLTTPTAVDGLATAAYAGIANDWCDAPITSLTGIGEVYDLTTHIKAAVDSMTTSNGINMNNFTW